MGNVVNLRQFRKRQKREDKEKQAAENRILHGTSTKLKKQAQLQNEIEARRLDGKSVSDED